MKSARVQAADLAALRAVLKESRPLA
jgi:hypothetical protein